MNPLGRALAQPPASAAGLAVGYSGGLDSTVLLHALRLYSKALPLRAIHVCHHLQPQAEQWAAHCARRCGQWDVRFTRLDVDVQVSGQGVEAAARQARYRAVAGELAPGENLVTAHHAEDQAETFLLQALRGAGVKGLAAMPDHAPLGAGGHWRPWRELGRDLIRAYAQQAQLDWIDDPSNHDPSVDRSYLRVALWPALQRRWPAAAGTLARSARHAAEAEAAIEALAAIDLAAVESGRALAVDRLAALAGHRQTQVLRRWLARAGLDTPDHRHLRAIRDMPASRLAASPCVQFAATEVRLFDHRLYAMPKLLPPPPNVLPWSGHHVLELPAGCGTLSLSVTPAEALDLQVGFRTGGERLPDAAGRHRALKDFLRERRVAPWIRERMPLIYHGPTLIAVADIWRHPKLAALPGLSNARFVWRHGFSGGEAAL